MAVSGEQSKRSCANDLTTKKSVRRFSRTPNCSSRGVGETTDIVEKEMYTFLDKGDRSMTLRPEGTAGVVRAYVENKLYGIPDLTKLLLRGTDVPL